jgi:serine/threonine protein kinase
MMSRIAPIDYSNPTPHSFIHPKAQNNLSAISRTFQSVFIDQDVMKSLRGNLPQLLTAHAKSCTRQGHQSAYIWSCSNPRLSTLFVLCEDIPGIVKAAFYHLDFSDDKFPFSEDDFQGVAVDPKRMVDNQWRVMMKDLPRNGNHHILTPKDHNPLRQVDLIRTVPKYKKTVDRVCYFPENLEKQPKLYARKSWVCNANQQRIVETQIKEYNKLKHPNIVQIFCSYTEANTIAILTANANCSLELYLSTSAKYPLENRVPYHLRWMVDLVKALHYIHSLDQTHGLRGRIAHRAIRPDKIIVVGENVFFAPFGLDPDTGSSLSINGFPSPPQSPASRSRALLEDSEHNRKNSLAYIYAAPETQIADPNNKRLSTSGERLADVFSLGCVLLSLFATGVRGYPPEEFQEYRMRESRDASFHANMTRVNGYLTKMYPNSMDFASSRRTGAPFYLRNTQREGQLLSLIRDMIAESPGHRKKMRHLVGPFDDWFNGRASEGRLGGPRTSYDDRDMPSVAGASDLRRSLHHDLDSTTAVYGADADDWYSEYKPSSFARRVHNGWTDRQSPPGT